MSHVAVSHVVLIIFFLFAYCLRRHLLPRNIFLITGPAIVTNAGPAIGPNIGTTGRNLPFCLPLFGLPPIYQTPRLADCSIHSKSLLSSCDML